MNKLELTDEHKEKLIEMFKTLFPDYNGIDMDYELQTILYCKNTEDGATFGKPFIVNDMNWFEFCTLHLYNEIKRYGISYDLNYHSMFLGCCLCLILIY